MTGLASITCAHHPERVAADRCSHCGQSLCGECLVVSEQGEFFCGTCDQQKKPSGRAAGALVVALIGLNGLFFLGIPAVIMGSRELRAIKRGESPWSGRNLARGGLILGWIEIGLMVLVVLAVVLSVVLWKAFISSPEASSI